MGQQVLEENNQPRIKVFLLFINIAFIIWVYIRIEVYKAIGEIQLITLRLVVGLALVCGLLATIRILQDNDDVIQLLVVQLIISCVVNNVVPLVAILHNKNMFNFVKSRLCMVELNHDS